MGIWNVAKTASEDEVEKATTAMERGSAHLPRYLAFSRPTDQGTRCLKVQDENGALERHQSTFLPFPAAFSLGRPPLP